MKSIAAILAMLLAVVACGSQEPTAPPVDAEAIYTAAARTFAASTPQTPTRTLTPWPTWTASSTAGPTMTPRPAANAEALAYINALQAAQLDWIGAFQGMNAYIQDMAGTPALYFDAGWKADMLTALDGLRKANEAMRNLPEPPELLRTLDALVDAMTDDTERLIADTSKFLVDISYADAVISDTKAMTDSMQAISAEIDRLIQ